MSTNYNIVCKFCNQEIKHLGKVSNNKFLSNFTKVELLKRLTELGHWELIKDEYDRSFTVYEFIKQIPKEFELVIGEFS